jgi:3-oxoadipate enol-lactonase
MMEHPRGARKLRAAARLGSAARRLRGVRKGAYRFRMPYAIAPRATRIHYKVHGTDGPWVVLLMGLGASSALWLDVPERLARAPYRVLVVDSVGTGRSDRLRGPCSLRAMASHVVHAMDAAGAERAYVVGMSMGGMVAQHVALGHPHRLEGLVLMATTPGILHGGLPTLRAMKSLLRASLGRRSDAGQARDLVADLILPRSQRELAAEIIDRVAPAFRSAPTRTESFVWQLLACMLHSTGRDLGRIRVPTVVVTGDDDIVMGRRSSHVLASRIPDALLEIVPSCGHGISFTHPDAVARAIARLRGAPITRQAFAT